MRSVALALALVPSLAGDLDALLREPITAEVEALAVEVVAAGQRGELSLVVLESADRTLPLAIRIDAGPVELDDNRLDWAAVVDPLASQPRLRARFRAPPAAGRYPVHASVDYWVCREGWCRRKHGELDWVVPVD